MDRPVVPLGPGALASRRRGGGSGAGVGVAVTDPTPMCPRCDSVEWFPGAACFQCGWEGSAAEAYEHLYLRLKAWKDLALERGRLLVCYRVGTQRGAGKATDKIRAAEKRLAKLEGE